MAKEATLTGDKMQKQKTGIIPAPLVSAFHELFSSTPSRSGGISSDGPTGIAIAYVDKYSYYHSIDLTEKQVRKLLVEARRGLNAGIDYLDKQAREADVE